MKVQLSLLVVMATAVCSAPQRNRDQFAKELRTCYQVERKQLSTCLKRFLVDKREVLADGIPELDIPALEPAKFPLVRLVDNTGFEGNFTDIRVFGLTSGFDDTTLNIKTDIPRERISIDLLFPRLKLGGKYRITTNFLSTFIPFLPPALAPKSVGIFIADLYGVTASGSGRITNVNNFFQVSNLDIDFDFKDDSRIELRAGKGANQVLTDLINTILNDKSTGREIINELKPELRTSISDMVMRILNQAMNNVPIAK